LPVINLTKIGSSFRPFEKLLFQALMPETKSIPVPVQNLNHVPASVAENKQMAGQGILLKMPRYQN
jgi:hypothetical protein